MMVSFQNMPIYIPIENVTYKMNELIVNSGDY